MTIPKLGARGQTIVIDLLSGLFIFLLIGGSIAWAWSNKAIQSEESLFDNEKKLMAERALDLLVKTPGKPSNWDRNLSAEVKHIGLVKRSNVVDREKLKQAIWRTRPLEQDLIASWHFNETTGTAFDSSENGNDLDSLGGADQDTGGLWGTKAVSFDGESIFYPFEDGKLMSLADSNLTYAAWIRTASDGIVMERGGSQSGARLDVKDGFGHFVYRWGISSSLVELGGTTRVDDGEWHHIAGTVDPAGMKLYVDGILEGSNLEITIMTTNPGDIFTMGYTRTESIDSYSVIMYDEPHFNGIIEEARVYSRALERDEIRALQEWNQTFVKQRLLIGVNDYYFRLFDPNNGWTKEDPEIGDLNFGRNPKELNNENLEQITVRKPVTFEEGVAIAELVLYREN